MIKHEMDLSGVTPLNRVQIEHLVHLAGKFTSRILLEHKNRTINGKSMLGLLSMGMTGKEPVVLIVDGEDEEIAAQEMKKLLDAGVTPPKDAANADIMVHQLKHVYANLLGENLVGIYLHGSLAAGCFQWEYSDIDFLVVVRDPLTVEKKIAVVEALYALESDAPPAGFEMSVVLESDCRAMAYPMPFDLHYSSMHRSEYEKDARGFCEGMHGDDPDLITHILTVHAYGAVIHGPSAARVFGNVKREDALAAIREDLSEVGDKLHDRPVYYVLTMCRALAYYREGLVLSKKTGGEWALKNLPHAHQSVIQAALNAYQSGRDMFYDENMAEEFCYEVMEELMK